MARSRRRELLSIEPIASSSDRGVGDLVRQTSVSISSFLGADLFFLTRHQKIAVCAFSLNDAAHDRLLEAQEASPQQ